MPSFLSDSDVRVLQELVSWWRRAPRNQGRGVAHEPELGQTPEVYIAWVGAGGIPALDVGADTGTATGEITDDVPGSAECDIYKIAEDVLTGTGTGLVSNRMEAVRLLTRTVWNIRKTAVPAHSWALVIRDKFGNWIATESEAPAGDPPALPLKVQDSNGVPPCFPCTVISFDAEAFTVLDPLGSGTATVLTEGFTGSVTVVTSITWNPTTCALTAVTKVLTFYNGLLKTVG